jgi:hypothetical protein
MLNRILLWGLTIFELSLVIAVVRVAVYVLYAEYRGEAHSFSLTTGVALLAIILGAIYVRLVRIYYRLSR